MLIHLNRILFLGAFILFSIVKGYSQIIYIKEPQKQFSLIDHQTTPFTGEYLLKNVFGKNNPEYFGILTNNLKDTLTIHIDSLITLFKKDIDTFSSTDKLDDIDQEYFSKAKYRSIYKRIETLANKRSNDRRESDFKTISDLISDLPYSKERIKLSLKLGELGIKIPSYYSDATAIFNAAKSTADKISDLYEKGKAYSHIGDFASRFQINDSAIRIYYLAKECFYNCNKDKKIKYFEEGLIYQKTAYVFEQQDFNLGYEKKINYLKSAGEYFDVSDQVPESSENYARYLENISFFLTDIDTDYTDTVWNHQTRMQILKELEQWYYDYERHTVTDEKINYLSLYAIAVILRAEHNYKASLVYYIEALFTAFRMHDKYRILSTIENIAFVYTLLGNAKLAISYADLAVQFSKKVDEFDHSMALLHKAYNYLELNKYDSALVYANKVQFDRELDSLLYPISSNYLYKNVFDIKYQAFNAIKENSDSAWQYYNGYKDFQIDDLEAFAHLLQTESDAIRDWLDNIKSKETSYEKNLRKIAEENERLATRLKIQALEKARQDSIARMQSDSISVLNQRIAVIARDSTKKAVDFANKEAEQRQKVEKLNGKISNRNFLLTIAIIAVSFFLLLNIFFFFRNKKISKKLLDSSTSDLRLRSAIKNHNLRSHYSKIKIMLIENRVAEARDYCNANSRYFKLYYEALLKDQVTLQEEIKNFDSFIVTEKIFKQREIKVIYLLHGLNPATTIFLTDILAPLYENVLLKGYVAERDDYSFTIELREEDSKIIGKIFDNGAGNNNIQTAIRENSYLDMLRIRLLNYFELKRIHVNQEKVFQIRSAEGVGTEINFLMPYETI